MGKRHNKRKYRDRAAKKAGSSPGAAVSAISGTEDAIAEEGAISSLGKKTIAGGIGLLILGFFILTLTDREGLNWASTLSPVLILGAYGVIAYGIFMPEKETLESSEPSSAPETTKEDLN